MRCPHCHAKNEHNAAFCRDCGAWILAEFYTQPPSSQEATKKSVARKRVCIALISAVCAIALFVAMIPFWSQSAPETTRPATSAQKPTETEPSVTVPWSPYILSESHLISFSDGKYLTFLAGDTVLSEKLATDELWQVRLKKNVTDSVGAYRDVDGNLYRIQKDGVQFVANNVTDYMLSYSGSTILYTTMHREVFLYRADNTYLRITESAFSLFPTSSVISPNGEYVALICPVTNFGPRLVQGQELYYYYAGKLQPLCTIQDAQLLSISDDGQTIYALRTTDNMLLSITPDSIITELGVYSEFYASSTHGMLYLRLMYLNADHSQILYHQEDGSYLSTDGQPGQKISDITLEPKCPMHCNIIQTSSYCATYPHDELLGHAYLATEFTPPNASYAGGKRTLSVWYVDQTGQAVPLISNTTQHALDPTGRYVYYLTSQNDLQRVDLMNPNCTLTIAQNVVRYTVSADCSTVCYLTSDSALYCADLQQQQLIKVLGENDDARLFITRDYVLYYLLSDTLYVVDTDGTSRIALSAVKDCTLAANGMLYVTTENGIYISQADALLDLTPTQSQFAHAPT